jgi:hypothetical protein
MNRLLIAALVVIALVVAIYFVTRSEETVTSSTDRPSPLAKIDTGTVTKVVIDSQEGKGDDRHKQHIVLIRGEAEGDAEPTWSLEEPVKTDANQAAAKTLIEKIGSLEVIDVASEMPSSHEDLEVTDDAGIKVQVYAGSDRVAHFILGKSTAGHSMMRLPDQDIVYRLQGSLRYVFGRRTADWRDKQIFDFDREQISHIELRDENGTFAFARDTSKNDAEWTIEAIDALAPPPEEEEDEEGEADAGPSKAKAAKQPPEPGARVKTIENFDQAKVQSIVTTLARLRTSDFSEGGDDLGFDDDGSTRVTFKVGRGESAKAYVLLIGTKNIERNVAARRDDRDQIYLLTEHMAKRFKVDVTSFQKREPRPAKAAEAGDALGGDVPPDILKAAQQEMQRQKMLEQLMKQAGQGE